MYQAMIMRQTDAIAYIPRGSRVLLASDQTYPINIDDVKKYSKFFELNTDAEIDNLVDICISEAISNWESETGFLLLDQTLTSFLDKTNLHCIKKMQFLHTNISTIGSISYYPSDWDCITARQTIEEASYLLSEEFLDKPKMITLKEWLDLYPIERNVKIVYRGGFVDNIFTPIDPDIKKALAMQSALNLDMRKGIENCEAHFYQELITATYIKYTTEGEPSISIL